MEVIVDLIVDILLFIIIVFDSSPSDMVKLNCGVFWDIENVAVPRECDAAGIVSTIRSTIIEPNDLEERDFYVACNVNLISTTVGKSLESMRVNIVQPFFEESNNAADTKLILLISKFIKNWGDHGCAIIVVTGDSDFLDPLLKLKLNYDVTVYLIHGRNAYSRELLWCADGSYQLGSNVLKETSPKLKHPTLARSGFIKLSGFHEDAENHKRVHQINNVCDRIKAKSRVVRIAKGTVWIGLPDLRLSMNEHDVKSFEGIQFLGYTPKVEFVNFLWPDVRSKPRGGNQSNHRNRHFTSVSDNVRAPTTTGNNQMSIGVKVSTGHAPRRQIIKHQPKNNIPNISVSIRVQGPSDVDSSKSGSHSFNRRDNQLTNQKTDKNETLIRLPKVFRS